LGIHFFSSRRNLSKGARHLDIDQLTFEAQRSEAGVSQRGDGPAATASAIDYCYVSLYL
jgi:hypothetical protein